MEFVETFNFVLDVLDGMAVTTLTAMYANQPTQPTKLNKWALTMKLTAQDPTLEMRVPHMSAVATITLSYLSLNLYSNSTCMILNTNTSILTETQTGAGMITVIMNPI